MIDGDISILQKRKKEKEKKIFSTRLLLVPGLVKLEYLKY